MRVPVIATTVGGPSEVINERLDGLLVPPRKPEAWAGAIRGLIESPALQARLARNGQLRARAFGVAAHVEELRSAYVHVIGRRESRAPALDSLRAGAGRCAGRGSGGALPEVPAVPAAARPPPPRSAASESSSSGGSLIWATTACPRHVDPRLRRPAHREAAPPRPAAPPDVPGAGAQARRGRPGRAAGRADAVSELQRRRLLSRARRRAVVVLLALIVALRMAFVRDPFAGFGRPLLDRGRGRWRCTRSGACSPRAGRTRPCAALLDVRSGERVSVVGAAVRLDAPAATAGCG